MKAALLDTDILSLFLKGVGPVVERVAAYLQTYDTLSMSIITYYEIVSGLKYRDAHNNWVCSLSLRSRTHGCL